MNQRTFAAFRHDLARLCKRHGVDGIEARNDDQPRVTLLDWGGKSLGSFVSFDTSTEEAEDFATGDL